MQDAYQSARSKVKSGVALMLTFSAGMVDIVGYIALYHWFVAHMTGDTVHLGNQLVTGRWSDVEKASTIIGSFILGSILGRAVIEAGARKGQRTIASVTLLAEAALIFTFICIRSFAVSSDAIRVSVLVLLALLAAAMGLQTATLTKIGPLTIHTTFVTGMLNKFAEAVSEWFFWLYDQEKSGKCVARINSATCISQCPVHGPDLVQLCVGISFRHMDVLALERLGALYPGSDPHCLRRHRSVAATGNRGGKGTDPGIMSKVFDGISGPVKCDGEQQHEQSSQSE